MMEQEPLLKEKDIYLRLMTEADTERIVAWRNQDFVRKNFIYQRPFTKEGHLNWIKTMIQPGKAIQFIICTNQNAVPVGSVYLRDIDPVHQKAEYGIFIGEAQVLGKGYGTQAAGLMIQYAFEAVKLHKLMLRVLADNERARKSYEKAGFVQEAYLRDEVFLDGKFRDLVLMAVINQT